jgi:autotransporter-associated beta strand protein
MNLIHKLALAAVLTAAATTTSMAASFEWSAGGFSQNWSDTNNWAFVIPPSSWTLSTSPPGPSDVVNFEDALYVNGFPPGWTNVPGAVNNIVDANIAVGGANYMAVSAGTTNHFYTTLIPSGVTLTLGGLGVVYPALAVGDVPRTGTWYSGTGTNFSTIKGPGTLSVSDANGLISVVMRNRATLDLSGLNTFNATVSNLWVGVTADNFNTAALFGGLFLGQTNTITTSANPAAPGILLGSATNGNATATVNLGSVNTFNTDALVVGGRRSSSTLLQFGANYRNANPLPSLTLRGSAGNTAASTFSIADLAADTTSFNAIPYGSSPTVGAADFSGGTVDIWVDSLYIGHSTPSTASLTPNTSTAQGTLTVENGTVTATNVFMNYKIPATNGTAGASSSLVLRSNATMTVIKDLYTGFRAAGNTGFPGGGLLSVSDNAVLNVGGGILFTNLGSTPPWSPPPITLGNSGTINLTGGGTVMAGSLTGIGTISGASTITVSNALSANSDTAVGTLNLSSNLVLGSSFAITFNLGANTNIGGVVNDWINVGNNVTFRTNLIKLTYGAPLVPGLYTLMSYGGTQSGFVTWTNPARSPIGLVQGNGTVGIYVTNWSPGTLVWKGSISGSTNWDLTSSNWNNNGNADKFITFDNVIFDDTGLATNITIPSSIAVLPGNIVFSNNVNKYTLSQGGSTAFISGYTGIDKWGTNTLIMGVGSSDNSFNGPININQGTIQLGSATTGVFGNTADATNAITIASNAMLDLNGSSIGLSSGPNYARYINLAGNGIGGIGAITTTKTSGSPTVTVRTVTLTDDASVGPTNAGNSITFSGLNAPNYYSLDLGGHTLTTLGPGFVRISQLSATNSGSINVGGPYLGINNCIIDGPGTINLGAKYLNFYATFTNGYIAKAISVANGGAISANFAPNAFTIPLMSPITIANNGTLFITNLQPILASGQISGTGAGIAKYGSSNLVMSAANSYGGTTEVGAGSLVLVPGGSLASSLIQVDTPTAGAPATFDVTALPGGYTLQAGQTLNVNGFAAGNITAGNGSTYSGFGTNRWNATVAAGGTLAPGSSLVQGTLTINSNLTFSGGTAIIKLNDTTNAGAGINDLIAVGGNLSFTGSTMIQVVPVAGLSSQPYTLFTYGGTLSGTNNITLSSASPRYSFALDTSVSGLVRVVPTGTGANLLWQGGVAGNLNTWDVSNTTNWLNGASLDKFYQGDSVTFDDSATTNLVTMVRPVKPAAMTNNSSSTYVLNGSVSLLAGTLVANSGTFTIANTNNNLFNGDGIQLKGGNVTFNQPSNATITARLSGSAGSLNKNGTNTLTWTSPDSTTMSAPVYINAGTLRAASTNVLGSGTNTIASGATLDINGQYMSAGTVHASGVGADGQGALNNRSLAVYFNGLGLTNLVLDGNTTLGAASNRWDIAPIDAFSTATLQGNNFNLVKTGGQDLWIRPLTDTGLGDIDVSAGRLIFSGAGTTLGNTSSNIVVRTNAALGFANGIQDAGKNTLIQPGGQLYCGFGTNEFDGAITLSNGLVKLEFGVSRLTLGGNLGGPANLQLQGVNPGNPGTLILSGSNSYTGGTTVNDGTILIAGSNSLPATGNVTLSGRALYNQSGWPILSLGPVVTSAGVRLDMQTIGSAGPSQATLSGDGATWGGPIHITGTNNNCYANFIATTNGLTINGAIDGTNFTANGVQGTGIGTSGLVISGGGASVTNLAGPGITFNSLLYVSGSLLCNNSNNPSGTMTKLVLNAPGNYWSAAQIYSGIIQIGVDNAILPSAPLQVGNLQIGYGHLFVLDLNGHNQSLTAFTNNIGTSAEVAVWFGNSSTNADSTVSYVGAGTNIWSNFIVDAFDTNAPVQRKTGLTVSSGYLWLRTSALTNGDTHLPLGVPGPMANTYSGPTLVSGGLLRADANILNSPVTVSGTGTLGGTGTLSGPVIIGTGGTLSPGGSIGNLVISNNLTLSAGGKCYIECNLGSNTCDLVSGISNLTYAGTIVITNIGTGSFANGTTLKLFDAASYTAGPVKILPSSPGNGLMWDASNLTVDGTIKAVISTPPVVSSPTLLPDNNISFGITGVVGEGYSVRATTNLSLPLGSWLLLESGSLPSVPYIFNDLTATNFPYRFYRVSTP